MESGYFSIITHVRKVNKTNTNCKKDQADVFISLCCNLKKKTIPVVKSQYL